MRSLFAFLLAAGLSTLAAEARSDVLINIDKSTQRMTVSENGQVLYNWPVSTGKTGHATPSGNFTGQQSCAGMGEEIQHQIARMRTGGQNAFDSF